MYSKTLLNKERNFFELNKELEDKVKYLALEVDLIISRQEDVIQNPKHSSDILSKKLKSKTNETKSVIKIDQETLDTCMKNLCLEKLIKNENEKKIICNEFDIHLKDEDKTIETKKKQSTNETIIRFLQAQVTQLHTDIQSLQNVIKKKNEHCKELKLQIKKNSEKSEKFHNQLTSHKETILKTESLNLELQSKIEIQSIEISSLNKEIEGLKKDLKLLNQQFSNCEVRLNRSLEENEKFRSLLKIKQNEEKDLREENRKVIEKNRNALKNLERQRNEIFQAFKKQLQLIDNLKKQKAYLEASKEIQFIEEDFAKFLDWKPSA